MKVTNMISNRGNKIANQLIITDDDNNRIFQSYNTIIAKIPSDNSQKILLDVNWDYSKTTGKYRNIFLNDNKQGILKGIKEHKYLVTNLNS